MLGANRELAVKGFTMKIAKIISGKNFKSMALGALGAAALMVSAASFSPVEAQSSGPRMLPIAPSGGMSAPSGSTVTQQRVYWTIYRGTDYLKADDHSKAVYVAGVLDALNIAVRSGFVAGWLQECAAGREATEASAMFNKWLDNNLDKQGDPAAMLFWMSLGEECGYPMPSAMR